MTPKLSKGYIALRRHRASAPGRRYFITFNTKTNSPTLASDSYFASLLDTIITMEASQNIEGTTFIVMPDHIHMLFRLG